MNEVQENKMGVMSEGKLLMNMSLPMMISMLVQAMYNIVDSIFVAKIDQDALTAVSLAFPMQSLMIALGAGTGVGINALISRHLGEKNKTEADKVAVNGVFVLILSYIVVAVLGLTVVRPFYLLQKSNESITAYGVTYLSICMVASFGMFMQFAFERILQSTGRTVFTMISQTTGAVINLIFDPILIFGLLGFPKMGIAGAAIATVAGQIVAAIVAFIYNQKKNPDITVSFKHFRPDGRVIWTIYVIGIPSIIMQSIGSVMTTGMNIILNGLDMTGTAAAVFGVYFKLQSFFFMPVFGLNNGMIPIVSYNFGANKKKRMLNTMKYGYIVAFILTLAGFALFELIPGALLGMFDASESMLAIGIPALKIIGVHYLIAWFCIVTGSLFQAVGKATYSMWVSVCRQLLILLPVAYILAHVWGLGYVWWSFPIAELMSLMVSTVFLIVVKKKVLDRLSD